MSNDSVKLFCPPMEIRAVEIWTRHLPAIITTEVSQRSRKKVGDGKQRHETSVLRSNEPRLVSDARSLERNGFSPGTYIAFIFM